MHEQMTRLYAAAKKLRQIEGQTDLAKLLDESPQTVNNWESRGISSNGLLKAQERIGCDAIWLRDGVGEMVNSMGKAGSDLMDVAELTLLFAQSTPKGRNFILQSARAAEKSASARTAAAND